jgi:hypothetical protein
MGSGLKLGRLKRDIKMAWVSLRAEIDFVGIFSAYHQGLG